MKVFSWGVWLVAMTACATAKADLAEPVIERKAKDTLTAVEIDQGETLRFVLADGSSRTLLLEDTWAEVVLTNLKRPKKGFGGGGTLYRFGCRVVIDGQPMEMVRYVPVQESFYAPYVVDGMRIWPDGVRKIGGLFNENHGECVPRKAARFAIQDATLPICCEQELRPWYPNAANFIDVHESYNGDDVWLGPYQGADLHGGLDIDMPIGTPLWAPISLDEQFYFNSLVRGHNNNRWRGIRRWASGDRWVIQAHHMTRLLVPEHTPLAQGTHYAEAAGTLTGSHAHSHFVFKVGEEDDEVLLDPWILFWQIFENNKRRAGALRAAIASLQPAETGLPVKFDGSASRAGVTGNLLSSTWTFGDGGCGRGPSPTHAFTTPGVFPVTLVVSDGTKRATTTQHIVVSGQPVRSPSLTLAAPEEIEFGLRPVSAMDVYGTPVPFVPHTLRFVAHPSRQPTPAAKRIEARNAGGGTLDELQVEVEYCEGQGWLHVDREGDGNDQTILVHVNAKKLRPKHGIYRAVVTVRCPGAVNSPQVFFVELTTPRYPPDAEVVVDNLDDACYPSPWHWTAPRFHGPWPQGYRETYLVAAGRPGEDAFVRFQPYLAAGRYEVFFDERTPFRPTEQTPEDVRFAVRVRHRQGAKVVWVEPLKSRAIGTFEFHEGNDGYVQLETKGSTGMVVADAVHFKRLEVAEPAK